MGLISRVVRVRKGEKSSSPTGTGRGSVPKKNWDRPNVKHSFTTCLSVRQVGHGSFGSKR